MYKKIRDNLFLTKPFYHICNKTIDNKIIFDNAQLESKFLDIVKYYKSMNSLISYSKYIDMQGIQFNSYKSKIINPKSYGVKILSYSLNPNHYHLLVQEVWPNYTTEFISKFQNSFTKYFNKLNNNRLGPLFVGGAKKVFIDNESLLLHLLRYVNLNLYSSNLIKNIDDIFRDNRCSLPEYLDKPIICDTKLILKLFKSKEEFKSFICDRAEYQKTLQLIKEDLKYFRNLEG